MQGAWRGVTKTAFLAVVGLTAPAAALAQAWLPARGDGSFTLGYQFYRSQDRYTTSDGSRYFDGRTRQHGLVGYLTYGITDRLAVSVGLPPYFISSYNGPDPHRWPVLEGGEIATDDSGAYLFEPPTVDDGSSHGTFQDLSAEVSFMAVQGEWVVTPFVGFRTPTHGYEYHAQTAVGRRLWELRAGASVGGRLDPVLPDGYVQARYTFAYRQAVDDLRFNYSYVDLELGYFVIPSLSVRLLGSSQIAHDGLRDEEYPLTAPPPPEYSLSQWVYISSVGQQMRGRDALSVSLHHDQLQLQTSIDLGLGATWAVTPSLSLSAQAFRTVWGRGGRPTDLAVSFWTTIGFSVSDLFGDGPRESEDGRGASLD
jgi:hypothetical protein